ncbi:hypothetical protein OOK41_11685 [Micromonospora sp. NBC_01655]|uniref:hypothetical protein n=1 Tax=Micromonospora sp. NBC_01655 TaxID=2975983 RepID=UPI0022552850|nr:hypothetical protein [Micromonospora sp. NBC_01655]MCX4470961.1 hypothetical protein [Micromonospora sp. NBC_01655]
MDRSLGSRARAATPAEAAAKAAVTAFLDTLGYDAADVGPLAEGWRFQRDTTAYAALYAADPAGDFDVPARVDAERLRAALAAARRYADA